MHVTVVDVQSSSAKIWLDTVGPVPEIRCQQGDSSIIVRLSDEKVQRITHEGNRYLDRRLVGEVEELICPATFCNTRLRKGIELYYVQSPDGEVTTFCSIGCMDAYLFRQRQKNQTAPVKGAAR